MPTREVRITEHFDNMIDAGVASGRFNDASEVISEALRLLELRDHQDRAKLDWLRGAAKEGFDALDRGEGLDFDSADDFAEWARQAGEEVSAELAVERKSA